MIGCVAGFPYSGGLPKIPKHFTAPEGGRKPANLLLSKIRTAGWGGEAWERTAMVSHGCKPKMFSHSHVWEDNGIGMSR